MTLPDDPRKAYPRGTYAKVARQLGVAPQTVRDVALRIKRSARIEQALMHEYRKAQRRVARQQRAA